MLEFLAQADVDCGDENLLNVLALIKQVVKYLQILIPIGLILMGTIDMGKAVIAGDGKKIKEAQKPFVKRLISAIIVFLIPFIVNLAINLVATGGNEWATCWGEAKTYQKINVNSVGTDNTKK